MTAPATMTLTDFLLERIAEDEETARLAATYGQEWQNGGDGAWQDSVAVVSSDEAVARSGRGVGEVALHSALHVLTWDPARVLAECAAKRFLIDTLRGVEPADEWGAEPDMGKRANNCAGALRRMGLIYADHPDYQQEWRPTGG